MWSFQTLSVKRKHASDLGFPWSSCEMHAQVCFAAECLPQRLQLPLAVFFLCSLFWASLVVFAGQRLPSYLTTIRRLSFWLGILLNGFQTSPEFLYTSLFYLVVSLTPWNVTAQQKICVSSSTWKTQYWEQDPAFCRCLVNTCWMRERIKGIFGEHGLYGEDGIWMWDWRCKHFKLVV